jgi:hypothetical protein
MKIKELIQEALKPTEDWLYSFPVDLTNVGGTEFKNNAAVDTYIAKLEKKNGVKADVLDYDGPGGGWPEVMFTGTIQDMEKFLKWYHNGDTSSLNDDLNELKKSNSYWDSTKKKRVKNK